MVKLIRRAEKLQARGDAELRAKVEQQRTEIEAAAVKNERQNVTNHRLERDIVELRKELAVVQQTLASTRQKLDETRQKLGDTAEQLTQSQYEAEYQARLVAKLTKYIEYDNTTKYFGNNYNDDITYYNDRINRKYIDYLKY